MSVSGRLGCHLYVCIFPEFILILADLPEGLAFLYLSSPNAILVWNTRHSKDMETLFESAIAYLTDDASWLLFCPKFVKVRDDVRTYAASYGFALAMDWWAINEMLLCSSTITTQTAQE